VIEIDFWQCSDFDSDSGDFDFDGCRPSLGFCLEANDGKGRTHVADYPNSIPTPARRAISSMKRVAKRLSLFDLPADPAQGAKGPRLWWEMHFKALHKLAVADFVRMYEVEPIFYLSYPKRQVFLSNPGQAVIIDRASGKLTDKGARKIWEVDYRQVKAFRPQDVAPQIRGAISGNVGPCTWRPMVMGEITVPEVNLEATLRRISDSEHVFALHWPTFEGRFAFRVFGPPAFLEALRYQSAAT
jgi:hypothetical protein